MIFIRFDHGETIAFDVLSHTGRQGPQAVPPVTISVNAIHRAWRVPA